MSSEFVAYCLCLLHALFYLSVENVKEEKSNPLYTCIFTLPVLYQKLRQGLKIAKDGDTPTFFLHCHHIIYCSREKVTGKQKKRMKGY